MTDRTRASGRHRDVLKGTASIAVLGALLVLGSAHAATDIKTGKTINASALTSSDVPVFDGGTLKMDTATVIANAFTLDDVTTNTIDAAGGTGTLSGVLSGTGPMTYSDSTGGGRIILTGVNTYTGVSTISTGGTLALSGLGSISSSSSLADNGTFDISATTAGASLSSLGGTGVVNLGAQALTISNGADTFSGVISGTGSLVVSGGTEILSGANTYTGGTTIARGSLQIGAGGTAGSIIGSISNQGTLILDRSDNVLFSQTISGSGNVTLSGAGTTTFNTAQTYTGITTISAGTLALSGNGNISASSSVVDNAVLDLSALSGPVSLTSLAGTGAVSLGAQSVVLTSPSASGNFSGVISGSGALTVNAGTQILAGANTYTGGTTIAGGTLQLGNGSTTGSVIGNIVDHGTLAFARTDSSTFSGVISGDGAVSQISTGTTALSAVQSYTGLTTISSGTLALAGIGNISASGGVVDNGAFDISGISTTSTKIRTLSGKGAVILGTQTLELANANGTFAGIITGKGNVLLSGGSEVLTGNSSYSGTTTIAPAATLALSGAGTIAASSAVIDNGTLDISGSSGGNSITTVSGTGVVNLGAQTLTITNGSDTFSGTITGTGGITVGGGAETLSGNFNYTGATTINAGSLILTGASSLSTSLLKDNGTFDASGVTSAGPIKVGSLSGSGSVLLGSHALELTNAAGTFSGSITTTGGLLVDSGMETITSALNYTGGTTIGSGGTLQLGLNSIGGSIGGDIVDNGVLAVDISTTSTLAGAISGTGAFNQIGFGTTILTGANTYGGGTTISEGTLQIGAGGTSGTITGPIANAGTLAFERSDNLAYDGVISGSGALHQMGAGTLTLSGVNTYTGTTTIDASGGVALSGAGSIASSAHVVNNGTLDISVTSGSAANITSLAGTGTVQLGSQLLALTNASDTFSGVIAGTGKLLLGGGNETLSGSSTYTGATTIGAGKLEVDGSIASSSGVTVNSGGTLAGTGTVSTTIVNGGGTIAAGSNIPGTLKVNGDVSFGSGSIYTVNVSAAAASKLLVTGTANLNGTLNVANLGSGALVGQSLTVLNAAGGINGTFTLASNNPLGSNYIYRLSYDADDVFLTIDLAHLSPLLPAGATRNERNVALGIDTAIAAGATLPNAFGNLGNLSSADLAAATDQLSGEVGSDLPQIGGALATPFLGTLFDRIDSFDRSNKDREPSAWISVFDDQGNTSGDLTTLGTHEVHARGAGIVAGADWNLMPNALAGVALSGGEANLKLNDNLGKARADGYQLGGYGYIKFSPHIYGTLAVALGIDQVTTTRNVTVSGGDTLTGSFNALSAAGRYETGLYYGWITPYVAVQSQFFHTPAYTETASAGASTFALSYDGHTVNATRTELGAGQSGDIALGSGFYLNLMGRAAWAHDFTPTENVTAAFVQVPGSDFVVDGAKLPSNSALLSVGTGIGNHDGFAFKIRLNTALAQTSRTYSGTAGVDFTW